MALCSATKLLEQAVSLDTQAPCRPRTKERRPEKTEQCAAVAANTLEPAGELPRIS